MGLGDLADRFSPVHVHSCVNGCTLPERLIHRSDSLNTTPGGPFVCSARQQMMLTGDDKTANIGIAAG